MLMVRCSGCHSPLRVREEYAGKAMRCPTCGALMRAPATGDAGSLAVATVRPHVTRATRSKACPRCREKSPLRAMHCRFCGALFHAAGEVELPPLPDEFLHCPKCGAGNPERVRWTFWGSFYGPSWLHHVRCIECDYRYNGKTGKSNFLWAILFVIVPAAIITAIVAFVAMHFFAPPSS